MSAPIIGATKPHHLDDAAAAVDIDLTADEVTALEEHYSTLPPAPAAEHERRSSRSPDVMSRDVVSLGGC